jgi:hypothetical protein
MMTLRPPWRFQLIGMRTVIRETLSTSMRGQCWERPRCSMPGTSEAAPVQRILRVLARLVDARM